MAKWKTDGRTVYILDEYAKPAYHKNRDGVRVAIYPNKYYFNVQYGPSGSPEHAEKIARVLADMLTFDDDPLGEV